MQSYKNALLRSLTPALGALGVVSVLGGVGLALHAFPPADLSSLGVALSFGWLYAIFAFFYGALLVFLYGVPAYALCSSRGQASYLVAALIGVLPGLALFLLAVRPATFLLVFGVATALITHFFATLRGNGR